jgi:segregation and condensation protein A
MAENARLEPIAIEADPAVAVPVEPDSFELRLGVFEGPLQLLLHLIESRQLDILTVPLADVADAYVEHLARHPLDPANLAEFVAVAAQLIYLKSRRLLPAEPLPAVPDGAEEADEEELRRRIIEYRVLRDAATALGQRDGAAPLRRREPRESDLPPAPAPPVPVQRLTDALERLAAIPEPEPPPPEVVPREITIGQQIGVLRRALSQTGRAILQAILASCRSRTEATVTFMAILELIRRQEVRAEQSATFGPILIESVPEVGE